MKIWLLLGLLLMHEALEDGEWLWVGGIPAYALTFPRVPYPPSSCRSSSRLKSHFLPRAPAPLLGGSPYLPLLTPLGPSVPETQTDDELLDLLAHSETTGLMTRTETSVAAGEKAKPSPALGPPATHLPSPRVPASHLWSLPSLSFWCFSPGQRSLQSL